MGGEDEPRSVEATGLVDARLGKVAGVAREGVPALRAAG
jgi:hypothetical protein